MTDYHNPKNPFTTTTSMLDSVISSMETLSVQSLLQSLLESANQRWTYAIFWQPATSTSSPILGFGDGYYKGEEDKQNNFKQTPTSAAEQQHRKRVLRELSSLISGTQTESNDDILDEEVTDTEWFFLISMTQSFLHGSGLPGRAYLSDSLIWFTGADRLMSCECERPRQARVFGLQTLVCVPVRNGVVELGSTDFIIQSLDLVDQVRVLFSGNGGQSLDRNESVPSASLIREPVTNSARKHILLEDDTTIHCENKTSTEAQTSKRHRKIEEEISIESLREHFGRPLDDAATSFGVSRSTFKRICRDLGIKRWQNRKRRMDIDISSKLARRSLKDEEPSRTNFSYPDVVPVHDTVVARTGQDLNTMIVKVTYNDINIRFKADGSSGIAELENNVIERLHLERKSFSIKYKDDEGDWVLIACDKDVEECMEISRSLKKTTIKLFIDLPINHYAP